MAACGWSAEAAQGGVKVGVLTCDIDGGRDHLVKISKDMQCIYIPNAGSPQSYTGTISKLGAGLGRIGEGVIAWEVFAPDAEIGPGALQGRYGTLGGKSRDPAVLGGSDTSIALYPIIVAGDKRFDKFVMEVAGLTLKSA